MKKSRKFCDCICMAHFETGRQMKTLHVNTVQDDQRQTAGAVAGNLKSLITADIAGSICKDRLDLLFLCVYYDSGNSSYYLNIFTFAL